MGVGLNHKGYVGWKLSEKSRARLLQLFPPSFKRVVADHVTRLPFATQHFVPWQEVGRVVGFSCDLDRGIEVLVVEIDGVTERPDGEIYHITWSLDPEKDAKPMHSCDMLKTRGWNVFSTPLTIGLEPMFFDHG